MGNSRNRNIPLVPSPLSGFHSPHLVYTELQQLKEMPAETEDRQSSAVELWIPLEVLRPRSNMAYSSFLHYRDLSCREKWSRCGRLHFSWEALYLPQQVGSAPSNSFGIALNEIFLGKSITFSSQLNKSSESQLGWHFSQDGGPQQAPCLGALSSMSGHHAEMQSGKPLLIS